MQTNQMNKHDIYKLSRGAVKTLVILLFTTASAVAMSSVDLSQVTYKCNGVKLTKATKISDLSKNCKNASVDEQMERTGAADDSDDIGNPTPGNEDLTTNPLTKAAKTVTKDKVEFTADDGTPMKCYYANNVFKKCEAGSAPTPAPKAANSN